MTAAHYMLIIIAYYIMHSVKFCCSAYKTKLCHIKTAKKRLRCSVCADFEGGKKGAASRHNSTTWFHSSLSFFFFLINCGNNHNLITNTHTHTHTTWRRRSAKLDASPNYLMQARLIRCRCFLCMPPPPSPSTPPKRSSCCTVRKSEAINKSPGCTQK